MPNWCVTNWKIKGSPESIQKFCDTVNDLPNRPDVIENGFGKNFLGNLAAALGIEIDRNADNIRGTIDSDPELYPSLWFPGNEKQTPLVPEVSGDAATVSFSTASAWDRPYWLQDYFAENFDDYGFQSTDEWRNFLIVRNTEMFPEFADEAEIEE